jgi:hypothetical protein
MDICKGHFPAEIHVSPNHRVACYLHEHEFAGS